MKRPNIVVCLCDQLRAFEVGCYGHNVVRTPNIDALARGGVRFEVAVSNNPVCTPGRSCLLSGQYSRTCAGLLGNAPEEEAPGRTRPRFPDPTLPEVLRENGYRTALIGKWHVGAHPELLGFEEYVYPKVHHLNRNQVYFDAAGRARNVPGYAEDYNGQVFDEFLGRAGDGERPFFAFYNIATPHMPYFDVPPEYQHMYSAEDVELRGNMFVDEELPGNTPLHGVGRWDIYMWDYLAYQLKLNLSLPEGFTVRDLVARYYGMTTYTDYHVGRLMETLGRHGHGEDTIVVFTSDHGDMLGSHHRYGKAVLYEESIRIPLVFHWPAGLAPRSVNGQVASLVDLMPTLLSAAGLAPHGAVQGQDLMPVLSGERSELDRNRAFIETTNGQIGLRTLTGLRAVQLELAGSAEVEGTLLTVPPPGVKDERAMRFDLAADPLQLRNLVAEADDGRDELWEALSEWNRQTPWLERPLAAGAHC